MSEMEVSKHETCFYFLYIMKFMSKKDKGYINSSACLCGMRALSTEIEEVLTLSGKLFRKEITDGTNDDYK